MTSYWTHRRTDAGERFRAARNAILDGASDFTWPELDQFNWALEWFDVFSYRNDSAALIAPDRSDIDRTVTFDQMRQRSDHRANTLQRQGIRAGDVVIIHLGNIVDFWDATLALMKLRAHALPLYPDATIHDLQRVATLSGARFIISLDRDACATGTVTVVVPGDLHLDDSPWEPFTPDAPTLSWEPLMSYMSSGTTGSPNMITHTHVTYPVGHLSSLAWQGIDATDRHMNFSQPGWAKHSWSSLFVPWTAGATVVSPPTSADGEALCERIRRHGVTSLCAPMFVWRAIHRHLPAVAGQLRTAQTAGEALDEHTAASVRKALGGVELRPGYGQTEATAIAGVRPGDVPTAGCVGRPLPGYEVAILDDEGREAEVGSVCVRLPEGFSPISPSQRGSWRVRGRLVYRTGDVGQLVAGQLRIIGRDDDIFKREGHRVSPAAIESAISAHPWVKAAGVVGAPGLKDYTPQAYVVLHDDVNDAALQDVHEWARVKLSPIEIPTSYHLVSALPYTQSGKLRRFLLPECHPTLSFIP